jgi:hypothetical protein
LSTLYAPSSNVGKCLHDGASQQYICRQALSPIAQLFDDFIFLLLIQLRLASSLTSHLHNTFTMAIMYDDVVELYSFSDT